MEETNQKLRPVQPETLRTQSQANSLAIQDVLATSGLDMHSGFAASFTPTENGFQFRQSLLRGGCLLGFFAGIVLPIVLYVYPGGFGRTTSAVQLAVLSVAAAGWLAMLFDFSRETRVLASRGHLFVEVRRLGIKSRREFPLDSRGLEIYPLRQNLMMSAYGLRPVGTQRGLSVALSHKEAAVLKAMIQRSFASDSLPTPMAKLPHDGA